MASYKGFGPYYDCPNPCDFFRNTAVNEPLG